MKATLSQNPSSGSTAYAHVTVMATTHNTYAASRGLRSDRCATCALTASLSRTHTAKHQTNARMARAFRKEYTASKMTPTGTVCSSHRAATWRSTPRDRAALLLFAPAAAAVDGDLRVVPRGSALDVVVAGSSARGVAVVVVGEAGDGVELAVHLEEPLEPAEVGRRGVGRAAVAPVPRALGPRGEQRFERPQRAVAFGDGARAAGRRGARERLEDALKRGPRRQGGHPVALRVVRRRRRDPRAPAVPTAFGAMRWMSSALRGALSTTDDGARVGFGGIGGGYEDAGEPAPRGHPAVAAHPG